jgi:hypothetical protein
MISAFYFYCAFLLLASMGRIGTARRGMSEMILLMLK